LSSQTGLLCADVSRPALLLAVVRDWQTPHALFSNQADSKQQHAGSSQHSFSASIRIKVYVLFFRWRALKF
jgi:hypothetical protein